MKVAAVIPARWGSTRFEGKPLTDLGGKTMIRRIYEQVSACAGIDEVLVATDDARIFDAVQIFGGRAVMTSPSCASGTDRVAEALRESDAELVINVQGDQVVFDTAALSGLVEELKAGSPMATIAVPAEPEDMDDPNSVKVVLAANGDALYFSRCAIPYARNAGQVRSLKHVGIYGFSRETLERFTRLEPTPLERAESLEQLRALENGIPIRVVVAEGRFYEINTPEDRERLRTLWND